MQTYDENTNPSMNLYLRYFDNETFVQTVDEAIGFLASIPEIGMNQALEREVREYCSSNNYYPKRYKVRPRVYFIIIKTEAASMADFKAKKALRSNTTERKDVAYPAITQLTEEKEGWYEATIDFKRVMMVPSTGKFEYRDTHFVANVKAVSGLDAYNRVVDYLRDRVDARSQFPSVKGHNFRYRYLGRWK